MAPVVKRCGWIALAALLWVVLPTHADGCDDFNQCTVDDMCTDGMCKGRIQVGLDCTADCVQGGHCQASGFCQGAPAPPGTSCAGGCGTCQPVAPVKGAPTTCVGNPTDDGKACTPSITNPCVAGQCLIMPEGKLSIALCAPLQASCPDTDGDPCTDVCNFTTGQCEPISKCVPGCEQCDHATGQCMPTNLGGACSNSDVCSFEGRCEALQVGTVQRGICMPGAPSASTPTPTETFGCPVALERGAGSCATPTATNTGGAAPSASVTPTASTTMTPQAGGTPTVTPTHPVCVGDCNKDGSVTINELILGVNIALGTAPADRCASLDQNHDDTVAINELIAAVNSALNGCK
jgi:hypothetical protein